MAGRSRLTTRFFSYPVSQYEAKTGKGVLDLIQMDGIKLNSMLTLIKLGNKHLKSDEEAGEVLDNYLIADDNNSILTAFIDLIDDLDRDLKFLRGTGMSGAKIKEQFMTKIAKLNNDIDSNIDTVATEEVYNKILEDAEAL